MTLVPRRVVRAFTCRGARFEEGDLLYVTRESDEGRVHFVRRAEIDEICRLALMSDAAPSSVRFAEYEMDAKELAACTKAQ